MPKPKKLITIDGKRQFVDYDYKPREVNNRNYNRDRARNNPEYIKFYHSKLWRETRQQVLNRDYSTCVRCGQPAYMVDHIVPSKLAWQDRLNVDNLQSLCKECHKQKTRREWNKEHKGTKRTMNINIIAGYPASGKTTYVKEHLTTHDLVFDYDQLMSALTGQPLHTMNWDIHEYVELFYELVLRKLRSEKTFNNVWIIESKHDERLDSLFIGMKVNKLMLSTSRDECIARLYADGRERIGQLLELVSTIDNDINNNKFKDFKMI